MASVRLQGVHKRYGADREILRDIDLEVAEGELVVLAGPSGCGKSTLLTIVAGLEPVTSGRVFFDGEEVTTLPAQRRDVAMVFQSYALYPHKSVRENLAFGLRMRGTPRAQIVQRIGEVARTLHLEELLDRKPAQLSGGQRQRVALGRAIVREPRVFLLDEPLSNLDAQLRAEMRAELVRLHRRLGATMVYVTHDQEEAMTLGDRIAVLHQGRIEQVAPPLEIYHRPATRFVASFVGAPAMNFLDGAQARAVAAWAGLPPSEELVLGIRPEDIELVGAGDGELAGRVDVVEHLGSEARVHVQLEPDARELRVKVVLEQPVREGERIGLRLRRDRLHPFDGRTGRRRLCD
jgi:ABC-type sugar transport system ATPase subunit